MNLYLIGNMNNVIAALATKLAHEAHLKCIYHWSPDWEPSIQAELSDIAEKNSIRLIKLTKPEMVLTLIVLNLKPKKSALISDKIYSLLVFRHPRFIIAHGGDIEDFGVTPGVVGLAKFFAKTKMPLWLMHFQMAEAIFYDKPSGVEGKYKFFPSVIRKIENFSYPPAASYQKAPIKDKRSAQAIRITVISRHIWDEDYVGYVKRKGTEKICEQLALFSRLKNEGYRVQINLLKSGRSWNRSLSYLQTNFLNSKDLKLSWYDKVAKHEFIDILDNTDIVIDQFDSKLLGLGAAEALMRGCHVLGDFDWDNQFFGKSGAPQPANLHKVQIDYLHKELAKLCSSFSYKGRKQLAVAFHESYYKNYFSFSAKKLYDYCQ